MKLTPTERAAIFRGDHRALKRSRRPQVKDGQKHVLSWTRGGRQVVDRETGAVVEIPRKPTVWIEFMEPELRGREWIVQIIAYDEREPIRRLGATPGPPSEAGLKTRGRAPEEVKAKGERTESWTDETERGYTGSGRTAIDPSEGVDDAALTRYATEGRNDRAEFRRELEAEQAELSEETRRRKENAIKRRLRDALGNLPPGQQVALLAVLDREIVRAELTGSAD